MKSLRKRFQRVSGSSRSPSANKSVKAKQAFEDFLPEALEVQESPPSPIGRVVLWLIVSLFVAGFTWAALGEVDVVVTAPGRVVPSGQVKYVQAPESGKIAEISVHNGQHVSAGQVLIRLDSTLAKADLARVSDQLMAVSEEVFWREALEHWMSAEQHAELSYEVEKDDLAEFQGVSTTILLRHKAEMQGRKLTFERELGENLAEQATVLAERDRAQATLKIVVQRVAAYQSLLERSYGSKVQYLEMLQQQMDLETSLPIYAARVAQLREKAGEIEARLATLTNEFRTDNVLAMARLRTQQLNLHQEELKARRRLQILDIVSPVSGSVQELATHTLGGVVTPAQVLMKVVPEKAVVEVEAILKNKDIGFLREGQAAALKVDTFNFTKYGLLDAQVVDISNDAVEDKQYGWGFKVRLSIKSDALMVAGSSLSITPGMTITAEIKTGKRRLLEFFLSPLLRYKQESIRER